MIHKSKLLIAAITVALILALSACAKAPDSGINWDESYGIVVRQDGEDKYTIIMSPTRSEGMTQEYLDVEKEKYGYYSATLNSDGSVTRVIHKEYYDRLLGATEEITGNYAMVLVLSGQFPKIVHAAYTKDFKASVLFSKSEEPDQSEIPAMHLLMEQAKNYLAMTGQDPNMEMQSYIVNASTGKYLYGITEAHVDEIDEIIQSYLESEKMDDGTAEVPMEK